MGATKNSGLGLGVGQNSQTSFSEMQYRVKAHENEMKPNLAGNQIRYNPTPKHDIGGWGSLNPIKSLEEGQNLLENGYKEGKQIYNITEDGTIVKFQPDNTPNNGYHAYRVSKPRDIPPSILKQMLKDGKITRTMYNKLRKGKL